MLRQVITKSARNSATTTASATCVAQTRSFHSPFTVLSGAKTPSNTASKSNASAQYELAQAYEKQAPSHEYDTATAFEEPSTASDRPSGWTRLHVVCDPDPSHAPFGVKSGAYPVSEPFAN
ncbi:uncharacterized protein FOMMEDRAFT_17638 [Fomitiporia mediterranea MF3/22]|uniref:uncharacterized protein n=1 Tax=Fomitiporia mediterranea (strain MF3/22) TaxID=694068 RepID=UPI0004408736|nr:uncharacterized protein FOMMEDRAFT_17638 [Fomitiporia mediterranea MF3/22]EJD07175.1 hypothetical protein FOMMEDRAFT_17638 [Fomitiporia mediterranea MF3/22]